MAASKVNIRAVGSDSISSAHEVPPAATVSILHLGRIATYRSRRRSRREPSSGPFSWELRQSVFAFPARQEISATPAQRSGWALERGGVRAAGLTHGDGCLVVGWSEGGVGCRESLRWVVRSALPSTVTVSAAGASSQPASQPGRRRASPTPTYASRAWRHGGRLLGVGPCLVAHRPGQ